jgi:hypothetical protein
LHQLEYAVVEHAREQHADGAWSVGHCGRTQQRIDGRSEAVLGGSLGDDGPMIVHQEMAIGYSHVDAAGPQMLTVDRRLVVDTGSTALDYSR